jgi:hypothetical protein
VNSWNVPRKKHKKVDVQDSFPRKMHKLMGVQDSRIAWSPAGVGIPS